MIKKLSFRMRVIDILRRYAESGRPGRELWGLFDFEVECMRLHGYSEFDAALTWSVNHTAFLLRYGSLPPKVYLSQLIKASMKLGPHTRHREDEILLRIRGMTLAQGAAVNMGEVDRIIKFETGYVYSSAGGISRMCKVSG